MHTLRYLFVDDQEMLHSNPWASDSTKLWLLFQVVDQRKKKDEISSFHPPIELKCNILAAQFVTAHLQVRKMLRSSTILPPLATDFDLMNSIFELDRYTMRWKDMNSASQLHSSKEHNCGDKRGAIHG